MDESALFLWSDSPRSSNSSHEAYIKKEKCNPFLSELLSHENAATLNDVKTLVQQLYTTLSIEQHQLTKERELIERLEDLKEQLAPLEKVRIEISRKAEKRTTLVLWGGLAYMATQFGILARLTWWEYSWDIMEPVTYFITYGSAMAMYAYFVITRQVRIPLPVTFYELVVMKFPLLK